MEIEIWKPVKDFETYYEVSSMGKVRSVNREVINSRSLKPYMKKGNLLKLNYNLKGYTSVQLCMFNKPYRFQIHRLVALNFIPNPENKPQVNHINGITSDNRVCNLEWNTTLENIRHSYDVLGRKGSNSGKKGALSPHNKKVKCCTFDMTFYSVNAAAEQLDCDASTIIKVCKGSHIATKGLYFQYV